MFRYEIDEEIVLQQLEIKDAHALFQLIDQSRVYLRAWLPWVDGNQTADDSQAFIEHTIQTLEARKGLTTGIYYQGKLVGMAGYNSLDFRNKIGHIGYWLAEVYQGKGIMTRVARALTEYAFHELDLNRVEIRAAYENLRSREIPKRLSFVEEGKIRQAEWLYDHYVDHVVYGMLASDWENIR
ncbi:GNAT family N-acetyltransferase [Oceanobacillus sp. 143]|uniref:RimJ/RimL family protein N-acetyltransferase n=1 Tax=Oceanobacillus zhaokaii TaxID=2052660 RepID=A0A345PLY4_9BACI|nr:GNAT family protein [Oceanobacillus zhaokaii]AXI11014.1 RimJ/RimL family protein N-acetyltransferase [Oceanobacillus zhaokaii]QGS69999.1 GNAT family N-acetyltransferase [Oceanobacillus sp. 143]